MAWRSLDSCFCLLGFVLHRKICLASSFRAVRSRSCTPGHEQESWHLLFSGAAPSLVLSSCSQELFS